MNINKKTFTLINRINQSFDIAINNFAFAITFIFHIKPKIAISYIMSLISNAITYINLKTIRISYIPSFIANLTQTINNKTIKIIYSISERMNFVTTINIRNTILFVSNAVQNVITIMHNGKIHIIANPTIAVFFTLGTYDPSTLTTLDTSTLGALDHS